MKKVFKQAASLLIIGIITVQSPISSVKAEVVDGETSLGGFSELLNRYYENLNGTEKNDSTELYATAYEAPENLAIANVSSSLNIRKKPDSNSAKVGILAKDGACIVESIENGWAKIKSGEVEGYASAEYLLMGDAAIAKAKEQAILYATVKSKVNALNVRSAPSTDAEIITKVKSGERLVVTKEVVVNKDDPTAQVWVEVRMDDDENENAVAYAISPEFLRYFDSVFLLPTKMIKAKIFF